MNEGAVTLTGDGTIFYSNRRFSALRGEQGQITGYLGVNRDITERKRAEEKLRRSEAYLAEAQRLSHIGSWAWNVSTGKIFRSPEHLRILGLDPERLQRSASDRQWIHPEDRPSVQQNFERAVRERTDFEQEFRIVRPDGVIRHVHSFAHPVFNASGDLTEYVATIMDITERREAEEALQKAQAHLAHVTRLTTMGELTASIAHELNQPLGAIVTSGDACLSWLAGATPNLDEAREALGRIIRDGNRASDVITRIRKLSGKTGTGRERLDMGDVIQEVVALLQGEVRRNAVVLRTELVGDLPPVLGDRVQLQQVVLPDCERHRGDEHRCGPAAGAGDHNAKG